MKKENVIVLGKSEDNHYTLLLLNEREMFRYNVAYGYTETENECDWIQGHYFQDINDAVYFMNKSKIENIIYTLQTTLDKTFDKVTGKNEYQGKSNYDNETMHQFKCEIYDAEDAVKNTIENHILNSFYLKSE